MAAPAAAGAGEHSIQMPAVAAEDEPQRSAPEESLNRFVRSVACLEWAGNAFGVLAFTWATVVLLGGFCSSLNRKDFWFATVMTFVEAFRIFSRSYTLDNHSLFGTTRALRWISSFSRNLGRPQQGNEVVLITGLWSNLIYWLATTGRDPESALQLYLDTITGILKVVLVVAIVGSPQPKSGLRRRRQQLQLWALLLVFLSDAAFNLIITRNGDRLGIYEVPLLLASTLADIVTTVVAVLLLNLRPRCIAKLTSCHRARKLVSLAKVISAPLLAVSLVLPATMLPLVFISLPSFIIPFSRVVLSLGSLQSPASSTADRAIDVTMHILFLLNLVLPVPLPPFVYYNWANLSTPASIVAISSIILLAALLVRNLQIPVAVVQVVLSSWRLYELLAHKDYYPLLDSSAINLVPAIAVFYLLALCQGALYIMACITGLFSFFPRRSLVRLSKFNGQRGAKAIDLYYQDAYATRMNIGVLSAGNRISLANFAMDSLCSGSSEMELAGVIVLDRLLQESPIREDLIPRITSSYKEVSTLIAMLGWTAKQDMDIRLFAARVTSKLAGSIRIARFPGMINMVSLLLDAENKPAEGVVHREGGNGGCSSWLRLCCQRMKENWSLPKDSTSTDQNSLSVLGMLILEKLAHDHDNCAEIFKATNLISKAIGLMDSTNDTSSEEEQRNAVICSSLNFVRRLAITGEKVGAALRQELQKNPFLLNNLAAILEDTRSSPRLWKPAMDIIAKLALDKRAGKEIGRTQVIIGKSMHLFLARCGPANINDDQSMPMVAGEALANLAMWGTSNCSAILQEPGYEVTMDLKNMLCEDEYRYVAASLLQNLCAHCRAKLIRHPDASEHLSSALTIVMEQIMVAEGKQLDSFLGLTSEVGDVICEAFVHEMDSQARNGVELVRKLVSTANSNKKPNPEYPRMRRVIVKIIVTILESCHRSVNKMIEEGVMDGLMEALTRIERTPSEVEKYRVFYGNIGVVRDSGEPMFSLVARAQALIRRTTQTVGGSNRR